MRLERATRLIPRFRQRPVDPPGRLATPRWTDTHFDLSLHLRRVNAPTPATDATVVDARPARGDEWLRPCPALWQFTLVEQLIGGRAALIMKVHHSLTDGIGGMQLALLLFETTAALDPGEQVTVPRAEPDPSTVRVVRESLLYERPPALGVLRRGVTGAVPAAARTGARSGWGALADVPGHRPLRRTVRPAGLGHALEPDDRPGPRPSSSTCSPSSLERHAAGSPFASGAPLNDVLRRLR